MVISDRYNNHVVRQQAFRLVYGLFDKIPPSHFDELDSRLWRVILDSEAVDAKEQFLLERLLSWFRKDQDERGRYMTELLKLIRLPLIPSQYLKSDTMQQTYKEFGCFAEYKKRIASSTENGASRRHRSFYCLFKQYFDDVGAQQSGVKMKRFISALNEFEEFTEIELGKRKYFGATLHENKVYIFGGHINNVSQKSVSVFGLASNEERALPEMATARDRFASILVGKFIYVFGGRNGLTNEQLASCERFDLENETWQPLEPMTIAQSNAAVAVLNGNIYVAGGYNERSRFLDNVELFDLRYDKWSTMTPMHDARFCFDLFASKEYLFAIGESSSIERYDPLTTRWTNIPSFTACNHIVSSVVVDEKVRAIKKNGEFGLVKIFERGDPLPFAPWEDNDEIRALKNYGLLGKFIFVAESISKRGYSGRHVLFYY